MARKSVAGAAARTRKRKRSAFRDEFYADATPFQKKKPAKLQRGAKKPSRRSVSVWAPIFGIAIIFCIIAVAGSTAMIWLRKLGVIFGVEWAGDF